MRISHQCRNRKRRKCMSSGGLAIAAMCGCAIRLGFMMGCMIGGATGGSEPKFGAIKMIVGNSI
ncbi:hypothetical protein NECAME_15683 [Necator americanus]|uniref:Uncharacterized protein n=1 Tax=Necator americanus TaxID=51031 RepID=W2SGM0_NECAM|nr:hypothetical protein NECAME_15683 [Necator americanus]ETN68698.1 hypothetical protein NECAME_15683 [Necator americanus]